MGISAFLGSIFIADSATYVMCMVEKEMIFQVSVSLTTWLI